MLAVLATAGSLRAGLAGLPGARSRRKRSVAPVKTTTAIAVSTTNGSHSALIGALFAVLILVAMVLFAATFVRRARRG